MRTTISALGDGLLLEILARLPDLPNLARAAFAYRALGSSLTFRRRFCSLRVPPLLAFSSSSTWKRSCEVRIAHRKQRASYNPLTEAPTLFPNGQVVTDDTHLEFHTLSSQEDQWLHHVVCIGHKTSWTQARVVVFSSHSMEWQNFPLDGNKG
ncbi:hypothetical protein VPH35_025758 [Triticum aestivum]